MALWARMYFGMAELPGKPWLQLMGKGQVLQEFTEEALVLPAVTWEAMQGESCCGYSSATTVATARSCDDIS